MTFPPIGARVEIAPHLGLWMRGARYGEVVGWKPPTPRLPQSRVIVVLDKLPRRPFTFFADDLSEIGLCPIKREG